MHHASQGTWEIPYAWFRALERPSQRGSFADPEWLSRYGLLADSSPAASDSLPIGLAKSPGPDPGLGITCAACHTAQLEYRGRAIRVDGGPAMFDAGAFLRDLYRALWQTRSRPARFARFCDQVLGANASVAQRAELAETIDRQLAAAGRPMLAAKMHGVPRTAPGPGRIDAIGAGINRLLFRSSGVPHDRTDAPVDYPWLWDAADLEWFHYNGALDSRRARDVAQALFTAGTPEAGAKIDAVAVARISAGYDALAAPRWPEDILPPIDAELAARGEALFARHCASCHDRGRATVCGEDRQEVTMVELGRIGTDPRQALNFARRRASAPDGETRRSSTLLADAISDLDGFGEAEGCAPRVRAPLAYRARRLTGVWATGPFLHNGSVPTIYQLLSPVSERPRRFWVGSRELDPIEVGFRHDRAAGGEVRRTDRAGNANTGHEFADGPREAGVIGPALKPAERLALVEYLKTL